MITFGFGTRGWVGLRRIQNGEEKILMSERERI